MIGLMPAAGGLVKAGSAVDTVTIEERQRRIAEIGGDPRGLRAATPCKS
jgi:hypothetical protein